MSDENIILRTKDIGMSFSGVLVLKDINVDIGKGKVHALLGENGAGKSTLIKIISGIYEPVMGSVTFDGHVLTNMSPRKAINLGIATVHQELSLIPEMTVTENIFLGRETINAFGKVMWEEMHQQAKQLLNSFDIKTNVHQRISTLSVAEQQMVEIARALSLDAKLIILDEPTDVLTDKETEQLFDLIRLVKAKGASVIYISHRLNEIKKICDTFTVLRDGEHICTGDLTNYTIDEIVNMMVARELKEQYPYRAIAAGETILEVRSFSRQPLYSGVSFDVRAGEIVTFYGLVGAGRTEVMLGLLGRDPHDSGEVYLHGSRMQIKTPTDAHKQGVVYITESRKEFGIFPDLSAMFNISLSSLDDYVRSFGYLDSRVEKQATQSMIDKLSIRLSSIFQPMRTLSGGNQQKALLARSLLVRPNVLIFDEPTRGVDVASRAGIYEILCELKEMGIAIIVISSDMQEVLGISDRVYVMFQGRLTSMFERSALNEYDIANAAFGKNIVSQEER